MSAAAAKFGETLKAQPAGSAQPKEISYYVGDGSGLLILLKFRLSHFFDFENVFDVLLQTNATLGGVNFSTRTFVEMDRVGHIESDDGSIIHDATSFAKVNYEWGE